MTSDPIRLLDDPQVAGGLRGDLAHASAASVQGLDHGAGLAGLQTAIAAEAAAATGAATGVGSFAKVAIAILLVGGGAVAVWGATRGNDVATPIKAASTVDEGAPVGRESPPAPKVEPVQLVVSPDALTRPAPDVAPAPEEEEEEEDVVDGGEAPAKVHRPRAAKGPKAAAEADATGRVLREAQLVSDARDALGQRPSAALSLVQDAAREFPNGQLIEEREAIAIRALAKLGRTEAANARAERFLARYGSGPHAEAVRRAIGQTSE
jgi:hypothetical protein